MTLVPPPTAGIVARPRVHALLRCAASYRLLPVIAPSGYGKTTALLDYAATVRLPVCWYGLDRCATDPWRFLRTLVVAIEQGMAGALSSTAARLAPGAQEPFACLAATLVDELAALEQDWLLIVDNWHVVDPVAACVDLIGALLQHCPRGHVVLAGRSVPSVPGMLTLAARRAMGGLGAEHLRFTAAEVLPLLPATTSRLVRMDLAHRLVAQTNGRISAILEALEGCDA